MPVLGLRLRTRFILPNVILQASVVEPLDIRDRLCCSVGVAVERLVVYAAGEGVLKIDPV
jgi:hypothetical protein